MPNHRLLPFAIGLAVLPAGAYAQSDNSSAVLEEIVVTAERREASLQSVPVPVTAITAEALTNKQVTEARDLARFAPSLKMFNNITTPTNLSPSLRGSLQQDASLVVAESPFGIYVDDVYIARLNGVQVVDFTDPQPKSFDGGISLQLHSGGTGDMKFREIWLRDLTQR